MRFRRRLCLLHALLALPACSASLSACERYMNAYNSCIAEDTPTAVLDVERTCAEIEGGDEYFDCRAAAMDEGSCATAEGVAAIVESVEACPSECADYIRAYSACFVEAYDDESLAIDPDEACASANGALADAALLYARMECWIEAYQTGDCSSPEGMAALDNEISGCP